MATFIENVQDVFPESKMFTPDFSFIDTMLKRKESQYEQGFAKLNNQYSLINREVTHASNAAVRDQFLNNAKVNLKNLSSMDLSDQQNVNAAVNVFKPFYSNTNVIGDQALTAHWNQQLAIGNAARLKDGGKEFSQDNINYILQQKKAFADDDPSSVANYASSKRYYTPYYDWNKEVKEAMKDFKPTHTSLQFADGMYIKTVDNQSWNKLEISQYLNSVLSDKAKEQMRIEGAVRLGNDPKFLVKTYLETEAADLPEITKLIDKANADLKTEKDPTKIAELKRNLEYYDDQRAEITNNLKSLKGGDMSFLKKNAEAISFKSYYNAQISKLANGYSHEDIKQELKGNDVAMMYARFNHDYAIANYTSDLTEGREIRKEQREKANKFGPLFPVEIKGENKDSDFATLNAELKQSEIEAGIATQNLKQHIFNVSPKGKFASIQSITPEILADYTIKNPTERLVQSYNEASFGVTQNKNWMDAHKKGAESYVSQQISSKFGDKAYAILQKATNDLNKLSTQRLPPGVSPLSIVAGNYGISAQTLSNMRSEAAVALKYYNDTKHQYSTVNRTGFGLLATDPRYEKTEAYLTGSLGIKKPSGINFFTKPEGTDIRYTIGDETMLKDENLVTAEVNRLKLQLGTDNIEYSPETKTIVIKNRSKDLVNYLGLDPYMNMTPTERSFIQKVELWNVPGTKSPEGIKLYTNKQNVSVPISIVKSVSIDGKSSVYYPQVYGQTLDDGLDSADKAWEKAKLYADQPNIEQFILQNQ
jgi:hypothetical protein